jgi:hypothetical protein
MPPFAILSVPSVILPDHARPRWPDDLPPTGNLPIRWPGDPRRVVLADPIVRRERCGA